MNYNEKVELWRMVDYYRRKHARTGVLTSHAVPYFTELGYDESDAKQIILGGNCTAWRNAQVGIGYQPVQKPPNRAYGVLPVTFA